MNDNIVRPGENKVSNLGLSSRFLFSSFRLEYTTHLVFVRMFEDARLTVR